MGEKHPAHAAAAQYATADQEPQDPALFFFAALVLLALALIFIKMLSAPTTSGPIKQIRVYLGTVESVLGGIGATMFDLQSYAIRHVMPEQCFGTATSREDSSDVTMKQLLAERDRLLDELSAIVAAADKARAMFGLRARLAA